jgi:hypothetical protein
MFKRRRSHLPIPARQDVHGTEQGRSAVRDAEKNEHRVCGWREVHAGPNKARHVCERPVS